MKYNTVRIEKGEGGWGGPLYIMPDEKRNIIVSITGGGIHPIAKRIAELTGAQAVDGFKNPVENDKVACAVVDCGGTLRNGLFPKQRIPTVNILPGGPSGPMAQYCTQDLYVSGTKLDDIYVVDQCDAKDYKQSKQETNINIDNQSNSWEYNQSKNRLVSGMERLGRFMGTLVNVFFQAARDAVDMMIKNVIPFMIFLALMSAIITETGFGNFIATVLKPFTGSIGGLIIFALIIGIPILSPLLAPGAVIQSVLGVFIGTSIATGIVSPKMALPALFAISIVDACDFIPVAASLGEAKPETTKAAVPAMLFSRFATAPIAVLIGYIFGIGLY